MSDPYPYAAQRAQARRWLNHMRAMAWLGDAYLCAQPQPKLERKPKQRIILKELTYVS